MPVIYKSGDATLPDLERSTIIAHVVNDAGAWRRGFVVALGRRYPGARSVYRSGWHRHKLGEVQWVKGEADRIVSVANMFAQRGVTGPQPRVRYVPLQRCLAAVFRVAATLGAVVHMPRVGCGLGGGDWDVVRGIIEAAAEAEGADVVVFGGKKEDDHDDARRA